ncbi:MAG: FAD-dependent thymidylate synthase [Candidatus Liptonbacteria bacterium]|nr:FAD-dependent thymidylate synthase [Candidatus Liptonbacteria bacterium]
MKIENNPYIQKEDGRLVIAEEGKKYLESIVTNTTSNIYAFKNEANPLLVAASMARLSRRGSDLREIYLDEFAIQGEGGAEKLIERVVVEFGDDSVQQLMNVALVVEGASNLLTKKIERGRLRSYLEQSTRYIFFYTKDASGRYLFYAPVGEFPWRERYEQDMNAIFDLYSLMARGVTEYLRKKIKEPEDKTERAAWLAATKAQACDAVRPVLPVATKSTVGIVGSTQSIEEMVIYLTSEPLRECQETAKKVLLEARRVTGSFLKRSDMPERGLAKALYRSDTAKALKDLAGKYLYYQEPKYEPVTLLGYDPKDELKLVPRMLFDASGKTRDSLTLLQIERQVAHWPRAKRLEVFNTYIGERMNRRHKPGRALEEAHYKWQIVGDYGTFRDIQRHRMVDAFEWQNLTIKYGYEVPALVTEAGFSGEFHRCFGISEKLYAELMNFDNEEEAQYATLLGHRMCYAFIENAREAFHIHELRTGPQGHPGYRKIVQEMHNKLTRVHPLLGHAMKFVNMGEDPELTRLAAERVTQSKLALIHGLG